MAYVRKKTYKRFPYYGTEEEVCVYYQLVESRRVEGQPRQQVIMHLGRHATLDDALESWPSEISSHLLLGHRHAAEQLRAKLDRLKGLRARGIA